MREVRTVVIMMPHAVFTEKGKLLETTFASELNSEDSIVSVITRECAASAIVFAGLDHLSAKQENLLLEITKQYGLAVRGVAFPRQ